MLAPKAPAGGNWCAASPSKWTRPNERRCATFALIAQLPIERTSNGTAAVPLGAPAASPMHAAIAAVHAALSREWDSCKPGK